MSLSPVKVTPSNPAPKSIFTCPLCGKRKGDYKQRPNGEYWVSCHTCRAAGITTEYPRLVAEQVGAPGGSSVLADAPRWLGHLVADPPRGGRREALPIPAQVQGWQSRLEASTGPLRWLREERGLSARVIRQARIGWDGDNARLVFPMYAGGKLVAAKSRRPRAGAQMRAWAGSGRAWPLFPEPRGVEEMVLLVAGELDALCALSHGLPASSVTLGAGHWRDEWTEALHGRRVVVCFDNGEALLARQRTDALKAAGVDARRLDLRKLGVLAQKGDLSDYLNSGGSVRKLKKLIRSEQGSGAK